MHTREVLETGMPAALMTLQCLLLPWSSIARAVRVLRKRLQTQGRQWQGARSHRWRCILMQTAQLKWAAMPPQRCAVL